MITDKLFHAAVREMRQAQKTYFRTRSEDALIWSKRCENLVDEMLSDQPTLFDRE